MGTGWRWLAAAALLWIGVTAAAGPVTVEGVRLWAAPDNTRVVLDISAPVRHELFTLDDPERVVVDLSDTRLGASLAGLDLPEGLVAGIRSGVRDGHDLRLVLDLKTATRPKSFLLRPNDTYGHRLVIDLHDPRHEAPRAAAVTAPAARRELVIAIDAGHGGEDPGARGPRGTQEKDVVLAIARKLERLVAAEPGMRPVMIRDGDYYIGLRKRIELARRHRADLFISVHADAFRDRRVHGSSVYVLSRRGASTEMARWLAERENAADLVGGVSLDDKDDLLKTVLLDLSQSATIEASLNVAGNVLTQLRRTGRVHKSEVQQAGFLVLKSPDIPSLLVETAFISNPTEERRLRDPAHQDRLARAMLEGIRAYFLKHPPPGTLLAAREHVIERGDTLSGLAQRYRVSVNTLRSVNDLDGDTLRVGQTLRIPGESGG